MGIFSTFIAVCPVFLKELSFDRDLRLVPLFKLTSGKFEQILDIASLTSNCVAEKPLVSINVFALRGIDIEKYLDRVSEKRLLLAEVKPPGTYLRNNDIVPNQMSFIRSLGQVIQTF